MNDVVLAIYSDRLFMAAVGVYVLAMALHAAEYAALRSAPARGGARGRRRRPRTAQPGAPGRPPRSDRPARSRADRFGGAAANLVVLAALLQLGSIVTRGLAADRWPLGNMYEFTSAVCLAAVVTWLVVLRRVPALRVVALFVLLPVVILLFLAGTVLYARAAPGRPGPAVVLAGRARHHDHRVVGAAARPGHREPALPAAPVLAGVARWSTGCPPRRPWTGWPTAPRSSPSRSTRSASSPGPIWAEAAWGRFWGWDPKETVAFVAWVVYAAYLHARATAGWRSGRAAWINVAGLAVVLFNLFFINMVVAGLHSYAGI